MPVLEVNKRVKAHADLVWRIVSDLAGDPGVPPFASRVEVLGGEGLGMRRMVVGRDGYSWIEECIAWEHERRYIMQVEAHQFPLHFERLRYTCSVSEDEGSVLLRLYFDYLPRYGFIGRLLERFGERARLDEYAHQALDNWVRIIHEREWAYRVTVRTLLEEKGGHVHSVTPETTVSKAADMLRQYHIGSVLVLGEDESIAGVVSERDIVLGLSEKGSALLDEPVSAIMTSNVIVANPEDNMILVMACMSERRIRHLPVVEAGRTLGLISIGDVIKARMAELEGQSETLRDYIEARQWHELYREIGPAAYEGIETPAQQA